MTNKESLLKELTMCGFCCLEATLFLDTHPTDKEALKYFNKHNDEFKKLKAEYTKEFGPLSISDNGSDSWRWIDGKWPWEI